MDNTPEGAPAMDTHTDSAAQAGEHNASARAHCTAQVHSTGLAGDAGRGRRIQIDQRGMVRDAAAAEALYNIAEVVGD